MFRVDSYCGALVPCRGSNGCLVSPMFLDTKAKLLVAQLLDAPCISRHVLGARPGLGTRNIQFCLGFTVLSGHMPILHIYRSFFLNF